MKGDFNDEKGWWDLIGVNPRWREGASAIPTELSACRIPSKKEKKRNNS
jgi:hypothetical protein